MYITLYKESNDLGLVSFKENKNKNKAIMIIMMMIIIIIINNNKVVTEAQARRTTLCIMWRFNSNIFPPEIS